MMTFLVALLYVLPVFYVVYLGGGIRGPQHNPIAHFLAVLTIAAIPGLNLVLTVLDLDEAPAMRRRYLEAVKRREERLLGRKDPRQNDQRR